MHSENKDAEPKNSEGVSKGTTIVGPYSDRKRLTFEQAEGVEALPSQLKLKEISPQLTAALWGCVYSSIMSSVISPAYNDPYIKSPWRDIFYKYHVERLHKPADIFDVRASSLVSAAKSLIYNTKYTSVFGFIQFIMRSRVSLPGFSTEIERILADCSSGYTVYDGDTIVPIASDEEGRTVTRAFADLTPLEFNGARQHLKHAVGFLASGDFPDSVRESIHAVESVARILENSGNLSQALDKLEKKAAIHSALKKGFISIYGYASDEKGIRHPLLNDAHARCDEVDAIFMVGACAAFTSYLIGKARDVGLLSS